jgi:hypothetical protein
VNLQTHEEHAAETVEDPARSGVGTLPGFAGVGSDRSPFSAVLRMQRTVGNRATQRAAGFEPTRPRRPVAPLESPAPNVSAAARLVREAAIARRDAERAWLLRLPPDPAPAPPVSPPPPPPPPSRTPAPSPAPVPAPPPEQPAPTCETRFTKASSFQDLIALVQAAEVRFAANGITSPKDQIHALRGVYYGTTWSMDYTKAGGRGEKSATRNEGFQRFTRPSEDAANSVPPDVRAMLDCGLFEGLRDSPEVTDPSGRQVDVGHLVIGLDARFDPKFKDEAQYTAHVGPISKDIALGGTGLELVTWLGDLGGGAASLALKRGGNPKESASSVFVGSDYGGSVNLEGDVAGFVVASGGASSVGAPSFAAGKRLSDALLEYLAPAGPGPAWTNRVASFIAMYGGVLDASGTLTNASTLVSAFQPKIQAFACNYLASRVKDKHVTLDQAKTAGTHIVGTSQEVATAFVDALADAAKSGGGKLEAKRFPSPTPAGAQACGTQINVAAVGGALGL